jgi:hypothetical protein
VLTGLARFQTNLSIYPSSKLLESVRKGLFRSLSQNPVTTPVFVQKVPGMVPGKKKEDEN